MVPELSRSADHLCPSNIKTPVVTSYGQFLKTSDFQSPRYTVSFCFFFSSIFLYLLSICAMYVAVLQTAISSKQMTLAFLDRLPT